MERLQIPTASQIQRAERLRTLGRLSDAAKLMQSNGELSELFPTLPSDEQTRLLMAARIHADSEISLARRSWRAEKVASHLGEGQTTIRDIYRNPNIGQTAQKITTDIFGNPYEFSTEMARDEIKYMIVFAQLTGNTGFLTGAINRLTTIIEQAQEPTAKTLARFEQAQILDQQRPTSESFTHLRHAYQEAAEASARAANWERAATIASRYTLTALQRGRLRETTQGIQGWAHATRRNPAVITILPREIYKRATQGIRQAIWRQTTPRGANYSNLVL